MILDSSFFWSRRVLQLTCGLCKECCVILCCTLMHLTDVCCRQGLFFDASLENVTDLGHLYLVATPTPSSPAAPLPILAFSIAITHVALRTLGSDLAAAMLGEVTVMIPAINVQVCPSQPSTHSHSCHHTCYEAVASSKHHTSSSFPSLPAARRPIRCSLPSQRPILINSDQHPGCRAPTAQR